MDNVIQLPGTERDVVPMTIAEVLPSDNVLNGALGKLETVFVVGIDEDGDLYLAANNPSLSENAFLLQRAINKLVQFADGDIEVVHS